MYTVLFWHCSTVPGNVTGVMLICEVIDQDNQCTVEWNVSDYIS